MMNSVEFTRFLNELRAEYDLPLLSSTEEMADQEDFMTEEGLIGLEEEEDIYK